MFPRHLKEFWTSHWLSIRGKRFNPAAILVIVAHQITFSCSPVTTHLVEITRARYNEMSKSLIPSPVPNDFMSFWSGRNETLHHELEENWSKYLLDPKKLVDYIKQYHCVGNLFFIMTAGQFATICYLHIKSTFHLFVTGTDQDLANYYADRYFPRIYHSYADSHNLDSFIASICTYILFFRLLRLYSLIKNSIINRNGYETMNIAQLNFTNVSSFELPLFESMRFLRFIYGHKKACMNDEKVRKMHLTLEDNLEETMNKKHLAELIYFHNPIDFTCCFNTFENDFSDVYKANPYWAKDWFVATPCPRIDPTEFSLLVMIASIAIPLATLVLIIFVSYITFFELCTIAKDNNQDNCLAQLPLLLFDPYRFVRLFDIFASVLIQLPQQIEAAFFYWDCSVMIARARKVNEALQVDLDFCSNGAKLVGDDSNPAEHQRVTPKEKKELNNSIWLHIRLTRCIHHEFRDLRMAHSTFLDALFVGGGLLISVSTSSLLVSNSLVKQLILGSFIVSCCVPIILSVFYCILTEVTVSTMSEVPLNATTRLSTNSDH